MNFKRKFQLNELRITEEALKMLPKKLIYAQEKEQYYINQLKNRENPHISFLKTKIKYYHNWQIQIKKQIESTQKKMNLLNKMLLE